MRSIRAWLPWILILLWAAGGSLGLNQEGIVLMSFRMQITRDPQGIFRTWNATQPNPCNWTGVHCDEENRVEKLLIHNAGLQGTISPALGNLRSLKTLSLPKNRLSGHIPSELSLISSLWKLNLSSNLLTGIVPSSFGRFPVLRMIDLSKNTLSGIIPPQLFEDCPKLKYVSFSENLLSGIIPSSMGNCGNLEGIDFAMNGLQGSIPSTLGRLPHLEYLFLRRNRLSGSIPVVLGACKRLQLFDVSHNLLSGSVPSEFVLLEKLITLLVNENSLSGMFPSEVLYLRSLQTLNASANMFSGTLPGKLAGDGCHSLTVLDLSFNSFEGSIPLDFGECMELVLINLSHNKLSSVIPDTIGQLHKLRGLDFSHNELTGIIPDSIKHLSQLSVLRLHNNPIGGSIPEGIGKLELAQVIDLDNMRLQGSMPQTLSQCRFLLELNLSHNDLNGTIPRNLNNMTYLHSLLLDHNKIQGIIPAEIGRLADLEKLDLSFNRLTGFIPTQLGDLSNLVHLNLSFNNLTGLIPMTGILPRFNRSSFVGNAFLCGLPLTNRCTPIVWDGPTASPVLNQRGKTHVLSVSAIAAIVVAAIVATGVVVVTILNMKTLRPGKSKTELFVYESTPPSPESSPTVIGKLVLFSTRIPSKYVNWQEGTKALVDKECVIGYGPLGTVYKAVLEGGVAIAVKKLSTLGQVESQEEFEQEIAVLSGVRHKNLVAVEGYYWSTATQLLLSQYLPNDSLFRRLHQRLEAELPMPWWRRFNIAVGAARGLAYLHHDCTPPVLLLNFKSSNVLLDDEFEAHVSDYGLKRLLPRVESYMSDRMLEQALGYVAPEMVAVQSSRVTDRCDVYSFGVVLLELVTGRRAVENLDTDVVVLCEFARAAFEQGRGAQCIDGEMSGYQEAEIMQVLRLGLQCTAQNPSKRPSMAQVVQVLELISA